MTVMAASSSNAAFRHRFPPVLSGPPQAGEDAREGGLGVAARAAVAGRVTGLDGGPLPAPCPPVRARLARAQRRARLYVLLRSLALALGGRRLAALGRGARDRLLRGGS